MGDYDRTIGPLFLGIFVNVYLYGIVMFQYAAYYTAKFGDRIWVQISVGLLLLINVFYCAISIYMAWTYCVVNFINPDAFGAGFWVNSVTPICTAASGFAAHLFLGYRFFRLTKNRIAPGVIAALAVGACSLALSAGVVGLKHSVSLNEMITRLSSPLYQHLVQAWLIVQTILDAFLAGSVGYALYTCELPFMASESAPRRLARGAIQTGFLAFFFSFAGLIAFIAGRNTAVYAFFTIPMSPIYSNVILDTLLARKVSTAEAGGTEKIATDIWMPTFARNTSAPTNSISLHSIHVRTEVYSDGGRGKRRMSNDSDSPKGKRVVI
ncbi:hypothetical protein FPV67DRAFT_1664278 [Lyophyllum atratum]|nr:hypothetical protein FPV67DRAFT_1664278 [Lyophyllum atratum]